MNFIHIDSFLIDLLQLQHFAVVMQSCWLPILKGMAEGVKADHPPVRLASAKALATALSDRHVKVVPSDLLVTIMSSILIPSINLLLDLRLQSQAGRGAEEANSNTSSAVGAGAPMTKNIAVVESNSNAEKEAPAPVTPNLSEVGLEDETDEVVVLIRCAAKVRSRNAFAIFELFFKHEFFSCSSPTSSDFIATRRSTSCGSRCSRRCYSMSTIGSNSAMIPSWQRDTSDAMKYHLRPSEKYWTILTAKVCSLIAPPRPLQP
jgi:hypothetical protein